MSSCGAFHALIVTEDGELYAWGCGPDEGDHQWITPTLVDPGAFQGAKVAMTAGGAAFSAAVMDDGAIYTFGAKGPWLGQGQEDDDMSSSQMTQRPVRLAADLFNGDKVLMAACGTLHQVVVSDEGHVYCWGQGGPRLGHGDVLTRAVPVAIPSRLFADDKVLFVACGAVHTAAVTHTGALYTWGFGGEGRLGHGDTCMRSTPTVVDAIGQRFGSGLLRARVVTVAGGGFHTAAITEDGHLWTWGQGRDGALGHGDRVSQLLPTRVQSLSSLANSDGGCGGSVSCGSRSVSCGSAWTALLTTSGSVYVFGKGEHGCLGLGNVKDRLAPALNVRLESAGAKVVQVACGHAYMLAVCADGGVWLWGLASSLSGEGVLSSGIEPLTLLPTLLDSKLFASSKVARITRVPVLESLTFASVTHARLGQASPYVGLLPELVERIIKTAWPPAWPAGLRVEHRGISRLLGDTHTHDVLL